MSEQPRYHINVFWYPVERCWVAALAGACEAIERWIAAAQEAGLPVPEPCYCPALYAAA
jgi:hypothetical protein